MLKSTFRDTINVLLQGKKFGSIDQESERKTFLFLGIVSLGSLIIFSLGAVAFYQNYILLGTVDFMVGGSLIGLLFLFRITQNYSLSCFIGIIIVICFFLFIFFSGSANGYTFMWHYTFPLLALFLLGTYHGTIASLFLFVPSVAFLFFDLASDTIQIYTLDFTLRYIPSYLAVFLFAYLYERGRGKQQRELSLAQENLEKRILERTKELVDEVQERRNAQAATLMAKKEWEWTFNSLPEHIVIINDKYEIIRANKAFCDHAGLSMKELIHTKCFHILHSTDSPPHYCPHQQLRKDHLAHSTDIFDDTTKTYFNIIHAPLHDEHGEFIGAIHVSRDITDQKEAEAKKTAAEDKLRKAEKMEAIGLMAGGVAHDLNNILSGIASYPELLLMEISEDSNLRAPLETIRGSGKRAAEIVADLLTVARGVAAKKISEDINVLVTEYLDSPEHQKIVSLYSNISCSTELQNGLKNIACSPVHIKKCLMNLMTNAAEAIIGNGHIVISSRNQVIEDPPTESAIPGPGEYAVLTISDDGPGIPDKDIDRIFEPFYTKKVMGRSGTGIGLAVVWNTVQDHGGSITVSSSENGTVFELYFPVTNKKNQPKLPTHTVEQMKGNGQKILIIDDEQHQLEIASRMLSHLNYKVAVVSSGEEAITYLEKNDVDLLVLDMIMDPGMNGLETYKQAIQIRPGIKTVIASGYAEDDKVRQAQELGAGQFIKKPYSIDELAMPIWQSLT